MQSTETFWYKNKTRTTLYSRGYHEWPLKFVTFKWITIAPVITNMVLNTHDSLLVKTQLYLPLSFPQHGTKTTPDMLLEGLWATGVKHCWETWDTVKQNVHQICLTLCHIVSCAGKCYSQYDLLKCSDSPNSPSHSVVTWPIFHTKKLHKNSYTKEEFVDEFIQEYYTFKDKFQGKSISIINNIDLTE